MEEASDFQQLKGLDRSLRLTKKKRQTSKLIVSLFKTLSQFPCNKIIKSLINKKKVMMSHAPSEILNEIDFYSNSLIGYLL